MTGRKPDIIHAHEWQTAAVPMLFWETYYHNGLDSARLVFTIHNLDSPGECRQDEFAVTGLPLSSCWIISGTMLQVILLGLLLQESLGRCLPT